MRNRPYAKITRINFAMGKDFWKRDKKFFLSIMGFGEDETRTLKCIQNSDDLDKLSFALTAASAKLNSSQSLLF